MASGEFNIKMKKKSDPLYDQLAKFVGAGKDVSVETVDFSDPNRPKTCLEVDFPIIPVNQVAIIEGNAGKPIYQLSKWWARRRSSVFRSMLLAASMKAPEDETHSAKAVWDVYYANHQKKGALSHLKVADVFMGGGTTIVEGSRLGMKMYGVDLNPVAWFVVRNELARPNFEKVRRLLDKIQAEVKPQLMPYYSCDCPKGHKGHWVNSKSGQKMSFDFDPCSILPEDRIHYSYQGPEIIYEFWAKHVQCQVTGCGHRTPVISSPVIASKEFTVEVQQDVKCKQCGCVYDIELQDSRIAPRAPFVNFTGTEFAILEISHMSYSSCPKCNAREPHNFKRTGKKKIQASIVLHPTWLHGQAAPSASVPLMGGSAGDDPRDTENWNNLRSQSLSFVEVRGPLPSEFACPQTGKIIYTTKGTVPRDGCFTCGACGKEQSVLDAVKNSGKPAPFSSFAIQGRCPECAAGKSAYNGRFFAKPDFARFTKAEKEWFARRDGDLAQMWPRDKIQIGAEIGPHDVDGHLYTHWWMMFNSRQLLAHAILLKEILTEKDIDTRLAVLGAHQQYLRNQNMFCFYNKAADKLEPHYSKNEFHPKATPLENSVFSQYGRGHWESCTERIFESLDWAADPWERLPVKLANLTKDQVKSISTASIPVHTKDPASGTEEIICHSSTDLSFFKNEDLDLIITDPPFGEIVQYAELSDFFYVWLKPALMDLFPQYFVSASSPKTLEVVSNSFRNPENPDLFYQRLLTDVWRESFRVLKQGGILAFTFHHDKDEPWIAVLQSLFDAGFYLEATYPIRSDETKGDGDFGSKKVEYDIIHVCRKRLAEPVAISWPRLRRQIVDDIRQLQTILEYHSTQGLPEADLQVIKRGKALEYFSRHYGKVFIDEGREFTVRDALIGINQLLTEDGNNGHTIVPTILEPFTRQFLNLFRNSESLPRDQIQKFMKGTGAAPSDFEARGWCTENKKIFSQVHPLEFAKSWVRKHRANLLSDLDQALFLIGACIEGSGISATDTLNNTNLKPHPALGVLLEWYREKGWSAEIRTAAHRAETIFHAWKRSHQKESAQMDLFING